VSPFEFRRRSCRSAPNACMLIWMKRAVSVKPHRLLEPFVIALERLGSRRENDVRLLFAEVAKRRPDLLEQSLFAERSRRTAEIEKVLRSTIAEIDKMAKTGTLPPGLTVPYFAHLRLNHSTGRLHVGHSVDSIILFPNSN
jgi:hypothetical protein